MGLEDGINRRRFLMHATLLGAGALLSGRFAQAQAQKNSRRTYAALHGTYAKLGTAITNGFKLTVSERDRKLGGRELEYSTVDDEAEPAKVPEYQ